MIVLHWVGTAVILYLVANVIVDILTSKVLTLSSLAGKSIILLILWLILART